VRSVGNQDALIYLSAGGTWAASQLTLNNVACDGNFANTPDINNDTLTGYISGTTLTITSGTAKIGEVLTDSGVALGTLVDSGSAPTFTIYPSQTVGSAGSPVTMTGHTAPLVGLLNCVKDQRQGSNNTNNLPRVVNYSVFRNTGHIPFYDSNSGDGTYYYSAFIAACLAGRSLCHGEMFEDTSGNTYRNYDITGNVQVWGGSNYEYNALSGATSPMYLTSGLSNNAQIGNAYIRNNLLVANRTNCANAPPYNPANPCTGIGNGDASNVSVSRAFFDLDGTSYVNSLTVSGNVVAAQASAACITRSNDNPAALAGAVLGVLSAGVNFTVTTLPTAYSNNEKSHTGIYPGMLIVNSNATDIANGWTDTTIQTFAGATSPAFTNTVGSLCAAGAGAPGQSGGIGCGSMILNASEPVTAATVANFNFVTNLNALSWSNNWSVGGNYGVSARAITSPGYSTWSTINCP
jgi:hypothetical protein